MVLCDIGNTSVTFFENGKISRIDVGKFDPKNYQKVYYICVNDAIAKQLNTAKNFINLEPYFALDTIYQGLGIDRIAACCGVKDGVVIDAGSAITIDIMSSGMHLGGYILPGIAAQLKSYENISPRLKFVLNTQVELEAYPQKTQDAISYGIVKPIVTLLNAIAGNKNLYFTGGDGEFLSRYFKNAIFDRTLIFRSMATIIKQKDI